jgi:hypothetical protein
MTTPVPPTKENLEKNPDDNIDEIHTCLSDGKPKKQPDGKSK